jgi:hypothetical protein
VTFLKCWEALEAKKPVSLDVRERLFPLTPGFGVAGRTSAGHMTQALLFPESIYFNVGGVLAAGLAPCEGTWVEYWSNERDVG